MRLVHGLTPHQPGPMNENVTATQGALWGARLLPGVTICSVDRGVLTVIAGQLVTMWSTRLQRGHLEMTDGLYPR